MPNKYYNLMSKINADEEFKRRLEKNLTEKLVENFDNVETKKTKTGIIVKIKKTIITLISILTLLIGGGIAYAALGGTISGVPILEWAGIKFSDNYINYVEPVQNQALENDDVKVTLESTVSDYGFTILQFRVNISEELAKANMIDNDGVNISYLSFNDPVVNQYGVLTTELGGANYNLIINGKDVWVRGRAVQSIEKLSNYEFLVYQMYFLDDNILKENEEYTITLKDVALELGNGCNELEGEFNVQVSKEKAKNNTVVITPSEDVCLKYKKMEKRIEEIYLTPLQNIIKVKTVFKNVNIDDLTYTLDDDYVDMIDYIAFNQNNETILSHTVPIESKIIYEDGTIEELEPGEYGFSRNNFKNATYELIEMIAVEQNENINEMRIRPYESGAIDFVKRIGEYQINLDTNKVTNNEKNVIIYDDKNHIITDEYYIWYKNYYGIDLNMDTSYENDYNQEIIENEEVISLLQSTKDIYLRYLKVDSIKKDSDLYLVTASLYNPIVITEDEYIKLVKKGEITLNNKTYKYQTDDGGTYSGTIQSEYGFVIPADHTRLYAIKKYENGYAMYLEVGGMTWSVDNREETLKFYLDGKTIVMEVAGNEDTTLEKYYSKFDDDFMKNNKVTIGYYENEGLIIEVDKR